MYGNNCNFLLTINEHSLEQILSVLCVEYQKKKQKSNMARTLLMTIGNLLPTYSCSFALSNSIDIGELY